MSKIIIYGGAFNPPTISHLETAKLVLEKSGYDELWFLPCYNHAFKNELVPATNRIEMIGVLLKNEERGKLWNSTYDMDIKGKYAIDTIIQLKKKYPKDEFAWLIGADNAKTFNRWKSYKEILENIVIIIVDRFGINKKEFNWLLNGKNIHIITPDKYPFNMDINSTRVRQLASKRLKNPEEWANFGKYYLTKEVLSYIEENNLYLDKEKKNNRE